MCFIEILIAKQLLGLEQVNRIIITLAENCHDREEVKQCQGHAYLLSEEDWLSENIED